MTILLITLYLVAIVLANLSVSTFGASAVIFNAFVFIALDLSTRDFLHEKWGKGRGLYLKILILILTGSLLSAMLVWEARQIAIASFVAFLASGASDTLSYSLLGERSKLVKMNGSNLVSAAVDSAIFQYIAFGAIVPEIFLGQFLAKVVGGFVWSLILNRGLNHGRN